MQQLICRAAASVLSLFVAAPVINSMIDPPFCTFVVLGFIALATFTATMTAIELLLSFGVSRVLPKKGKKKRKGR